MPARRAGRQRADHCQRCNRCFVDWHACQPEVVRDVEDIQRWWDGTMSWREYEDYAARQAGLPGESYEIYSGMDDYYERLGFLAKIARKLLKRKDIPADWRQPPGYPNYLLHSVTRELWRQAYDRTLPNGSIRHYPAKLCTPKNGAYSLTVDGVTSSRGVNALWRETFPEYAAGKKKPQHDGEWAGQIEPRRGEFDYYQGLAEWLGEGAAGIATGQVPGSGVVLRDPVG